MGLVPDPLKTPNQFCLSGVLASVGGGQHQDIQPGHRAAPGVWVLSGQLSDADLAKGVDHARLEFGPVVLQFLRAVARCDEFGVAVALVLLTTENRQCVLADVTHHMGRQHVDAVGVGTGWFPVDPGLIQTVAGRQNPLDVLNDLVRNA